MKYVSMVGIYFKRKVNRHVLVIERCAHLKFVECCCACNAMSHECAADATWESKHSSDGCMSFGDTVRAGDQRDVVYVLAKRK